METYCWLAAPPVAESLHRPVCVQALGSDLNTAWRLSFSDEKRVKARDALYKSTSYLILPCRLLVANNVLGKKTESDTYLSPQSQTL